MYKKQEEQFLYLFDKRVSLIRLYFRKTNKRKSNISHQYNKKALPSGLEMPLSFILQQHLLPVARVRHQQRQILLLDLRLNF